MTWYPMRVAPSRTLVRIYLMLCNYKPWLLCMAMLTKDSISYGSATYRCGEYVMGAAVKEVCFADLGVIIRGSRLLSCKRNNYEYSEEWFRVCCWWMFVTLIIFDHNKWITNFKSMHNIIRDHRLTHRPLDRALLTPSLTLAHEWEETEGIVTNSWHKYKGSCTPLPRWQDQPGHKLR